MNTVDLRPAVELITSTTRQRWVLIALVVVASVVASAVTGIASGNHAPVLTAVATALAIAAAVLPDTHFAAAVMALVAGRWAFTVDDVTTPWVIAVAVCLLAVHSAVALMAVVPCTASVDPATIRRWGLRTLAVSVATAAMWALTSILDQRRPAGSTALTLAALLTVAAGALAAARWSPPDRP